MPPPDARAVDPGFIDFVVTNRPPCSETTEYVVLENNHYKTVDEAFCRLHSAGVSPIGRAGKSIPGPFDTAVKQPLDVCCPQGRLRSGTCKIDPPGRALATRPHDTCGRPPSRPCLPGVRPSRPGPIFPSAFIDTHTFAARHRLCVPTDLACQRLEGLRIDGRFANAFELTRKINQWSKRGNNHEPEQPTYH